MPRPRVDPNHQRRPWRIYLSLAELRALGFPGSRFSHWARKRLIEPRNEEDATPATPPRPFIDLPAWGKRDAHGNVYAWHLRSRTCGTLTIRNGHRTAELDLADPEVVESGAGIRITYRDHSELREVQPEEE